MRSAFDGNDAIERQRTMRRLQHFLQLRFRILAGLLGVQAIETLAEGREHRPAGRVVAAVEEYGAEERLERVGEDRGPRLGARGELTFAELEERCEAKLSRDLGERLLPHQARPQARELAF